jgi:imidazoleglycerol-phosphate dehydratase/histidinol-phosphatase
MPVKFMRIIRLAMSKLTQKKVLFIDRDGTLIVEPPIDFQVDSLEKLEFEPQVITVLSRIAARGDYELVIVTNQDGLGTASFPEEDFWPAHNKMLSTFAAHGVQFSAVHIDASLPEEQSPNRKPGTGMLGKYFGLEYDLKNSFVIGDRNSDVELARNLGCRAIQYATPQQTESAADFCSNSWLAIENYLKALERTAEVERKTSETDIYVKLVLDGDSNSDISTGLGFLDHMLHQLPRHSGCDLTIRTNGDLHVDEHHTIEDTALALGEALRKSLGSKLGLERYGFVLPMDDCLAQVALDLGGRPWINWQVEFKREKIGDCPTEMFFHFFKSFSDAAQCNLFISAEGENEHHKIEAIFKGLARALRQAIRCDGNSLQVPSSKGVL